MEASWPRKGKRGKYEGGMRASWPKKGKGGKFGGSLVQKGKGGKFQFNATCWTVSDGGWKENEWNENGWMEVDGWMMSMKLRMDESMESMDE